MRTLETEKLEARRFRRVEPINEEEADAEGLFGSIRRVLGTALAMFESRLELVAVELREEKKRAVALICWGCALVFLGILAAVSVMGIVVFLLWSQAMAVLVGFSVFFVVLALASFFAMRGRVAKIPFHETVAQFKKDRETISESSSC